MIQEQLLRAYKRTYDDIKWEVLWRDTSPYKDTYGNLIFTARTLRILSCWITQVPADKRKFPKKFIAKTEELMNLLLPLIESAGTAGDFFAREEALYEA